jgi:hypothetical protein
MAVGLGIFIIMRDKVRWWVYLSLKYSKKCYFNEYVGYSLASRGCDAVCLRKWCAAVYLVWGQ